jgi:CBS domain-containing protein
VTTFVSSSEARRRLAASSVAEVMHRGVTTCDRGTGAGEVAHLMTDRRVHSVVVVEPARDGSGTSRVWGIVSDLDLLGAVTGSERDVTAGDLAHEPVIAVRPDMSLQEAAEAMVRHGVHHVIVADPDRHLPLGILSTLDVADALV